MLQFLVKLLAFLMFLTIYGHSSSKHSSSSIEQELNNIKIEIEKMKLTQDLTMRAGKLEFIEQDIKNLENKLHKRDIDINGLYKDIEKFDDIAVRQDDRIDDIGLYLTIFAILITVVILFFALRYESIAKQQADSEVKKWIDEKADKEFEPKVKEYLNKLQEKSESILQSIQEEAVEIKNKYIKEVDRATELNKKHQKDIDLFKKMYTNSEKEEAEENVKDLKTIEKKDYSFSDWYRLFLLEYMKNEFDKALDYIEKAIGKTDSNDELSMALVTKAITLGRLDRSEDAIKTYDEVVERFGKSENESLLEQVASALYNKGVRLGTLDRSEDEIKTYDEVVERFGKSGNESLLEKVASALVNKGATLGTLDRSEDEIKTYDEVVERFGKSENESLLEQVASALVNKIEIFLISGRDVKEDLALANKLYVDDKNRMMEISMLEILSDAKRISQDEKIAKWQDRYRDSSLTNWGFSELEEWNEAMQDDDVKNRIKSYIEIFKRKV